MNFMLAADIMCPLRIVGDVPKWLKGADSKSARRRKACGGSNPSISANKKTTQKGGFLIGKNKWRDLIRYKCGADERRLPPPLQRQQND